MHVKVEVRMRHDDALVLRQAEFLPKRLQALQPPSSWQKGVIP